jgi:hypothetical protein
VEGKPCPEDKKAEEKRDGGEGQCLEDKRAEAEWAEGPWLEDKGAEAGWAEGRWLEAQEGRKDPGRCPVVWVNILPGSEICAGKKMRPQLFRFSF